MAAKIILPPSLLSVQLHKSNFLQRHHHYTSNISLSTISLYGDIIITFFPTNFSKRIYLNGQNEKFTTFFKWTLIKGQPKMEQWTIKKGRRDMRKITEAGERKGDLLSKPILQSCSLEIPLSLFVPPKSKFNNIPHLPFGYHVAILHTHHNPAKLGIVSLNLHLYLYLYLL